MDMGLIYPVCLGPGKYQFRLNDETLRLMKSQYKALDAINRYLNKRLKSPPSTREDQPDPRMIAIANFENDIPGAEMPEDEEPAKT